jgi:hypothetical protein
VFYKKDKKKPQSIKAKLEGLHYEESEPTANATNAPATTTSNVKLKTRIWRCVCGHRNSSVEEEGVETNARCV